MSKKPIKVKITGWSDEKFRYECKKNGIVIKKRPKKELYVTREAIDDYYKPKPPSQLIEERAREIVEDLINIPADELTATRVTMEIDYQLPKARWQSLMEYLNGEL